jgi:signal-transduction protein with cAMP-binding, CBS, and nucleotidyltransferase domain
MEQSGQPISEIMLEHPEGASVSFEDHIFKAVYEMNKHKISLLPVLKDGVMVGIIRTVEVFQHIADVLLRKKDATW